MTITKELIRSNPAILFILEQAYFARPQACDWIDVVGEPNVLFISTKKFCCEDERAYIYNWDMEIFMPVWEREFNHLKVKMEEFSKIERDRDFGKWSKLLSMNHHLVFSFLTKNLDAIGMEHHAKKHHKL